MPQESKKATDVDVDVLDFDVTVDAEAARAKGSSAGTVPLLTLMHYVRCPSGKPLPVNRLAQLLATRDAGSTVRVFLGRNHQLRRFFAGGEALAGPRPAPARRKAHAALPEQAPAAAAQVCTEPFILYLADCRLQSVQSQPNGTLVMTLREVLPAPLPGAATPVHAHKLLLPGAAAKLCAHASRVRVHNAKLLLRREEAAELAAEANASGGADVCAPTAPLEANKSPAVPGVLRDAAPPASTARGRSSASASPSPGADAALPTGAIEALATSAVAEATPHHDELHPRQPEKRTDNSTWLGVHEFASQCLRQLFGGKVLTEIPCAAAGSCAELKPSGAEEPVHGSPAPLVRDDAKRTRSSAVETAAAASPVAKRAHCSPRTRQSGAAASPPPLPGEPRDPMPRDPPDTLRKRLRLTS